MLDCVYCYRGHGDACCFPRMVSMASSFHVLPSQGLSESRTLVCQGAGCCCCHILCSPKVSAPISMVLLYTKYLRFIFLPIMIVTLPLPNEITQYFPLAMVTFLQWFGFWSFAGLLTV